MSCVSYVVRVFLVRIYAVPLGVTRVHAHDRASLPLHAIAMDGNERAGERASRVEKRTSTNIARNLSVSSHRSPGPANGMRPGDTVSEKSIDTLLVIRVDKKYRIYILAAKRKNIDARTIVVVSKYRKSEGI